MNCELSIFVEEECIEPIPTVVNASNMANKQNPNKYQYRDNVTYTCLTGHVFFNNKTNQVTTCNSSGLWDAVEEHCKRKIFTWFSDKF